MQPSMWTNYLSELSPEDMVVQFAKQGWNALELSDEHSKILLERDDSIQVGRDFGKFAEDHGVNIAQGHLWLSCDIVTAEPAPIIDKLKRWLDLYMNIGITAAVLHPGGDTWACQGKSTAAILEARTYVLKILSAHIESSNLTICLENIAHSKAEDLLVSVDAVGKSNLGICLDTGHLNLVDGDQATFIRSADTRLKALHIADNEGAQDQHIMPYGRGTVDWVAVIVALREINYQGLFNLELPGENHCPMSIRLKKLAYIQELLATMLAT